MSESTRVSTASEAPLADQVCPNCGRKRPDSFCASCGQSDRNYARSLFPVATEFFRETFEVDSRIFRTLRLLLLKPGSLTREFSRNRRVSFVSPVRLYIVASVAFFFILSLVGDFDQFVMMGPSEADQELVASEAPTDESVEAFRSSLPPDKRRKVDDILARAEDDVGRRTILDAASGGSLDERIWIERFVLSGMVDILHDPAVIPQRFLGNMPIAMFFVLPFLALALAVLYFRRKRFYVEHLVFAIHVQTFAFVIYTLALLLPETGPGGWLRAFCVLAPYPYFVIALRRYYEDGWVRTIAKSAGVAMIYSLVLGPAFVISVFVTG